MDRSPIVGRYVIAIFAAYGAMVGDVAAQPTAPGGDWSFSIAPVAPFIRTGMPESLISPSRSEESCPGSCSVRSGV